ncbi:MAG TPA: hypothetical protein VKA26_08690 [Ignavibacteriaceae bacterium]|nr:hypothetical protein [Ignavibacteriaceae bacterium]
MSSLSNNPSNEEVLNLLRDLDNRVGEIENHLGISKSEKIDAEEKESQPVTVIEELSNEEKEDRLELQIGQFWFAKLGIIIFFIGIAFLISFPFSNIPVTADIVFGYLLSILIFFLSNHWRESISHLSGYLLGGALFLFFFTTLRLKFFGNEALITSTLIETILLMIAVSASLLAAVKRESNYLILLSIFFGYATAIVSENPYAIFCLIIIMSLLSVSFLIKSKWYPFLFVGIFLTYFTHLVWFINNPVLGNELKMNSDPVVNLLFLIIYSIIFTIGIRLRKDNSIEDTPVIYSSFMNAAGCYGLFLFVSLMSKYESAAIYHLLASVTFLIFATVFWVKEKSRYSTFIYAMLGYFALTVAIIYQVKAPAYFNLLCWQSIIVISTAIWFRSKFIILANFIIYILIFIAYLVMEGKVSGISLSFGIAALLSARILNWKKDRLELKTEQMRNAYLLTALVIIPYALYHAMPSGFISVSWIIVAIIYYVLSVVLKSKKYRWMALFTLGLTVGYVFIIGITNEDPIYKIVSFLALGFVMLIISIIYSKKKKSQVKS